MSDFVEDVEVDFEVVESSVVDTNAVSTLDFFLTSEPEAALTREIEVKRLGLVFVMSGIEDEALKICMKRSEKRQTKMEKQRGLSPERDNALMESLIIVESCVGIKKRLRSSEEATHENLPEFASSVKLNDATLLDKWGPRPQDVLEKWLLPGERAQLADIATDLAGYESNAVVEAGN